MLEVCGRTGWEEGGSVDDMRGGRERSKSIGFNIAI